MRKDLEKKLVVGAKIRLGERYCATCPERAGTVLTLIEGYFEYDNGLYSETKSDLAAWDGKLGDSHFIKEEDFDFVSDLFGNDLEWFEDCEILSSPADTPPTEGAAE